MRIAIVGTSGSGKTTLARAIATATGLPRIELDAINWQRGWHDLSQSDPDLFFARVSDALAGDAWVSDGNYGRVRQLSFARATDVVVLDYAKSVVMRRVLTRSFARAWSGMELWPGTGNTESFARWLDPGHPIRWAWSTHARRRRDYAAMMAGPGLDGVVVHHLRHPREADALVRSFAASARA